MNSQAEIERPPRPDGPASEPMAAAEVRWPQKYDLFGVEISGVTREEALEAILDAAQQQVPAVASFFAVDALVGASDTPQLREMVNCFEIVAPDGQPVRWALNLIHGLRLREPVCGPDLMWMLCGRAAEAGVPIYLYGGSPETLQRLRKRLADEFPSLPIAGAESPPFRPLTAEEDEAAVRRINESGARMVFVGLGHPKQDEFAFAHRDRIEAVQLCVGAAFDFLSGNKRRAPVWMRRLALEWLFRLLSEPRRLWRRYLIRNSRYGMKLAVAMLKKLLRIGPDRPARGQRDEHNLHAMND